MLREVMLTLMLCVAGGLLAGHTVAQHDEAPPTLTELQKLKLQNLTQRLEIAQLRAQAVQRDFDTARGELTQLLQSFEVKGYTFNVETLTYTKNPEK
jgi:hypothetical protein